MRKSSHRLNCRTALPRTAFFLAVTIVIYGGAIFAGQPVSQSPPPPTPPDQTHSDAAALRVTARLVQVNVIVQDKDGNPVPDLTKDDFTLSDKGQQQQIAIFAQPTRTASPISSTSSTPAAAPN